MPELMAYPVRVNAEQWWGNMTDKLRELIGGDLVSHAPPYLKVRTPDGEADVQPGWWILRWTDGSLMLVSESACGRAYYPAPPEGAADHH